MAKKTKKAQTVLAWGGFVDGKLTEWPSGFYDVQHMTIFRTRRDARRCCEDVRRVKVTVLAKMHQEGEPK